ncbi:MAG: hypothetical protein J1F09_01080 [Oscillospiraceae bacterium]|nr:hypothetical protein [Oscillospiraceae bacterium]
MKKIFSIITVCVICIFTFTACNQSTKEFSDVELVKWGEADRILHYSLEELEKDCDIAVVGTFVGDSTQDITYQYSDDFGKEIILGVKSFNTIEVKQVLMGDINVGDTLNVSQRYGVVDDRLITMSELTPMIKGDTWIFFLYNNYDSGIYVCCGDSDGRYPLPNSVNKTLAVTKFSNLGVYDELDFKSGIYSEILEKYDI